MTSSLNTLSIMFVQFTSFVQGVVLIISIMTLRDITSVSSKEFLDIQANIECGFTLKRVRDMIRKYSRSLMFPMNLAKISITAVLKDTSGCVLRQELYAAL